MTEQNSDVRRIENVLNFLREARQVMTSLFLVEHEFRSTRNQQIENGENRATDQNLCTSLQVADGNAEALRS